MGFHDPLLSVLQTRLPGILYEWAPGGKVKGNEYWVNSPLRNDHRGTSFSINVRTGKWFDFATGEKGNLISLYAGIHRINYNEAARRLSMRY